MSTPLPFTIVVPAYNAADTIARTLSSICSAVAYAQAKAVPIACEVVVVDDCSTDRTVEVAQAQDSTDLPVRVIRHAHNQGAGCARNSGAAQATGAILCFLDADDHYLPAHLAVCAKAFAQRPEIDFVCTRFTTSQPIEPSWIPAISAAAVGPFAIRRDAHLRLGGFPPFRNFEDVVYRRLADRVLKGWYVGNETAVYVWRAGNSFDRQLAKFSRPCSATALTEADQPPDVVLHYFEERLLDLTGKRASTHFPE
ncbi:glycosyltransferase family 2 protein [Azospirillum picis]|uniref:Glycosyltransferase involved in cell wall biosynthesis n=1 Tax=Azospirillum picis TaxID=488438 RepID=A0ABU0MU00_9PROT|nr:glycosyltransferase family A protein [Azospirillum picis]MBP2303092.1 glycosyltransferase involved in cell wall biosynthesis [Azospirillum picis]MDQ0536794.1 glycosyltransferase involved in cell wall biosynthesis [Azospirillum picis]